MARPQMLYLGNEGQISYPAIGNVEMGSGQKGTLSLWYHPAALEPRNTMVSMEVDSSNRLLLRRYMQTYIWRVYSNSSYRQIQTTNGTVDWRHVVATWDFTGGPGAGVLRLYIDGEEVPESPVTDASAPVGPPDVIRMGPGPGNTYKQDGAVYDHMAIWNDELSAAQVAELHSEGRLYMPKEEDGSGELLFGASWDAQYDAAIAEGSGVMTVECEADEYCRLDVGSRKQGSRFSYQTGMPRHDGSEDDRVPLLAVLAKSLYGTVSVTNTDEWAELGVSVGGNSHAVGAVLAPWMPAPTEPTVVRIAAHLDPSTTPHNIHIAVGPVSYVHGNGRRFICSASSTKSKLYSGTITEADDYWAGAEVSVITGPSTGQKLRVLTSSSSEQSVTLDGELSDAPPSGAVAIVEFPRRIEPFQSWGHQYRLECDLTQNSSGQKRFTAMECAIGGSRGYVCVDKGRAQMYPERLYRESIFFGKREEGVVADWDCTMWIEQIEMGGPAKYGSTDALDDIFMVKDPANGDSTKVWRKSGVSRLTRVPEQHDDPAAVQAEIVAPGTWRETVIRFPSWMEYDATNDCLWAPILAADSEDVQRVGYIVGTWNDSTGRVEWTDDPDPRNPIFTLDELQAVLGGWGSPYNTFGFINAVFQTSDGTWTMTFNAGMGTPDGMVACALTGASDRYSFDPAVHLHPDDNPITPFQGGRDKVVPEGGGIGYFGNRDCEHRFVENRWETDPSRRFWGYARTKTELHIGDMYHLQPARPLSCVVTGDFKNVRNVPWRHHPLVPYYAFFHYPHPEWYSASTVGFVVDDGGVTQSNVSLYASEDGFNFQVPLDAAIVHRETPPFNGIYMAPDCSPVQLGKRRIYWYRNGKTGLDFNMATVRMDGETLYALDDGETSGMMDTCELRRPEAGWPELKLNVDPKEGTVQVAVLDSETDEAVPGYSLGNCDSMDEGIAQRVTWDGTGLSELALDAVKLQFSFSRPSAAAASPELYAWRALPPSSEELPWCQTPKVEGKSNPTGVANFEPELSWEYGDPGDRPQSAFQVLVASSFELLDEEVGDLWDSGTVYSDANSVSYAGQELTSQTTYFWKVRVRNGEGVWSEEW